MAKPTTGPGRTSRGGQATGTRPLGPRPQRVPAEAKSPFRKRLERVSAVPLLRLHSMPKFLVPALLLGLFLVGLFAPPAFAIALLVVAAFVTWLLMLSWPALTTSARIIRVLVVAVLVAGAFFRLTGHG